MATYTPPPYFPQKFSPPDAKRYRKFKLIIAGVIALALLGIGGIGIGLFYLIKAIF